MGLVRLNNFPLLCSFCNLHHHMWYSCIDLLELIQYRRQRLKKCVLGAFLNNTSCETRNMACASSTGPETMSTLTGPQTTSELLFQQKELVIRNNCWYYCKVSSFVQLLYVFVCLFKQALLLSVLCRSGCKINKKPFNGALELLVSTSWVGKKVLDEKKALFKNGLIFSPKLCFKIGPFFNWHCHGR